MIEGAWSEADWTMSTGRHAYAMVLYLLDPGLDGGKCAACRSDQGRGPFPECLVPKTMDSGRRACTNCIFMGHAATCCHRRGQYFFSPVLRT